MLLRKSTISLSLLLLNPLQRRKFFIEHFSNHVLSYLQIFLSHLVFMYWISMHYYGKRSYWRKFPLLSFFFSFEISSFLLLNLLVILSCCFLTSLSSSISSAPPTLSLFSFRISFVFLASLSSSLLPIQKYVIIFKANTIPNDLRSVITEIILTITVVRFSRIFTESKISPQRRMRLVFGPCRGKNCAFRCHRAILNRHTDWLSLLGTGIV